jgi:hypothetical protein
MLLEHAPRMCVLTEESRVANVSGTRMRPTLVLQIDVGHRFPAATSS